MPTPSPALGIVAGSRRSYGDGYSRFSADALNFNVKDSGAVGDNVADDTAAIQKAIVDAERTIESFGGLISAAVYFPPGRYLISAPLLVTSNYLKIYGPGMTAAGGPGGQGFGGAIIRGVGAGPMFRNAVAASSNLVGLTIQDLAFDGRGLNAGATVLEVDNIGRSVFKRLFLNCNGVGGTPIALQLIGSATKATYYNLFEDITLSSPGVGVDVGEGCNANRFLRGVWSSANAAARVLRSPTTGAVLLDTCLFQEVAFDGTATATLIELSPAGGASRAADFRFKECRFEPNGASIIVVNGYRTTFVDCMYTANVTFNLTGGLGNCVRDHRGPYTRANLGASVNDYDPDGNGALGTEVQRLNANVGAINITGMSRGWDGRRVIFINVGANAITFTHQDALSAAANRFLMSTGANIVVAADDVIEFVYDATTQRWRNLNVQA